MSFGQNLKRLRTERGLNQSELAEQIGVWQTYISALENDLRQPSLRIATKLAHFFGVTVDYLNGNSSPIEEPSHDPALVL